MNKYSFKAEEVYKLGKALLVEKRGMISAYEASDQVASIITGIKNGETIEEINKKYLGDYSREDIQCILDKLEIEGVIEKRCSNKIAILADESLQRDIKKYLLTSKSGFVSGVNSDILREYDLVIYLHQIGECKYNRELCEKNISFLNLEIDNHVIKVGPYVIPGSTACLECINFQKEKTFRSMFGLEGKLTPIKEDTNIIDKGKSSRWIMVYCSEIIDDLQNNNRIKKTFINRQRIISSGAIPSQEMIVFSRVYNCKQCKKIKNNTLDIIDNGKDVFSGNNPIIYTKGGARSATYSFSKKMLDRAISESKIKIEVEEIKENELRDVIPSFQATAHLDSEDYITYGKGINPRQAYLSAGYEMVERLSARDYMSKEIVKYSPGDLTECLLDIKDKVNSAIELGLSYDEYDNNKEMDCVWGKSLLTGRKKLVPASFTFLTNTFFEGNYMNNGSSGLAAGAKIEDAILQALMEVIEHDAMIIGQCIKKRKPIVDYNRMPPDIKDVIIKIEKRGFKIVSRDYTNDIGIPVMVTWIWRENRCFDFASRGLGCSIYPMVALERSITEAVQTATAFDNDVVLDYSKKNYLNLYNNPGSLFNLSHFLEYEINEDGAIVDINKYTPNEKILTIEEYFDEVKKRIVNALGDTDIVYVDLTSHMFNIPVVKVIITKGIQELGEPPIITTDRLGKNGISGSAIEKYKGLYCGRFPH